MLTKQIARTKELNFIKKIKTALFLFIFINFIFHSHAIYCNDFNFTQSNKEILTYYLSIADFAQSFIEIPTSNVSGDSSTISSMYLAGRSAIYNNDNKKVGTCSASFLCMQNEDGIYTDISNFISVDNGLIVSWFTPTALVNLELDTIINSMVTECMVEASTKIGVNPYYGQTFSLIVSSDDGKIYFEFTRTGTIF
jgi:hypothetical protein